MLYWSKNQLIHPWFLNFLLVSKFLNSCSHKHHPLLYSFSCTYTFYVGLPLQAWDPRLKVLHILVSVLYKSHWKTNYEKIISHYFYTSRIKTDSWMWNIDYLRLFLILALALYQHIETIYLLMVICRFHVLLSPDKKSNRLNLHEYW